MNTKEYYKIIEGAVAKELNLAKQARAKGYDFSTTTEIYIAKDIADKVEGLVEITGIADEIRKFQKQVNSDEEVAFKIADFVAKKELERTNNREIAAEMAIRAGLAYLTQGAVSAPIEGIAKAKIKKNQDGSEYLSVYYAGPIRAAGGTAEALSIIVADYVRKIFNLSHYQPTFQEICRYVEEILWYKRNVHLQYMPTQEEIETIVRNVPVCIDGEPTEEFEVVTYRDLGRVETNRVRGGMCLVVAEGIAQKAPKLVKKLKPLEEKYNLKWSWLEGLLLKRAAKETPQTQERMDAIIGSTADSWLQRLEIDDVSDLGDFIDETKEAGDLFDEITAEPIIEVAGSEKYMYEIPAGRPVFSHPSRRGGFNLRYGRTRASGYAAVAIHPATMYLLGEFIATGTQLRLEFPGKAGIVTPCDTINGPTIVLDDGELRQVNTIDEALQLKSRVARIVNLGDILISAGDFIENNHKLLPSSYAEEWWTAEVKVTGKDFGKYLKYLEKPYPMPLFETALQISKEYEVPLHPKYTFFWDSISAQQLLRLIKYSKEPSFRKDRKLTNSKDLKETLEALCVFHKLEDGKIVIDSEHAKALALFLDQFHNKKPDEIISALNSKDIIGIINKISEIKIRNRCPTYVGARMGRPEKAKPRKMVPPPNILFPTGIVQGRVRDLVKAAKQNLPAISEISCFKCDACGQKTIFPFCGKCKARTKPLYFCPYCKRGASAQICHFCNKEVRPYTRQEINLKDLLNLASEKLKTNLPAKLVGVMGMTSKDKIPEPIEKGILRANKGIYVFKDGTVRFDATNAPLSHFRPAEIKVPIEKLKELSYLADINGRALENDKQVLELRPQDIIISDYGEESCATYLVKTAQYIDDLLEKFYCLERFYNVKKKEDLVGKLIVALAPHTSTGMIGRIIGFTKAKVCFANPAFHDAKRRDCDGDEDSVILLLDALINFSKSFIPAKRGGRMDAPLVITTILNPLEIDTEVYDVDVMPNYPLGFYKLTEQKTDSTKADVKTFGDMIHAEDPFSGWLYTHEISDINNAPLSNTYTEGEMLDKLKKQLELAEKIVAVDARDVCERILTTHFIPDMKGNLRTFSRQKIRCTKCNAKFRRPPLSGICSYCSGNLTLTVHKGTIEKYLNVSRELVVKYKVSNYIKEQIDLLNKSIISIFGKEKQQTLVAFK